MKLALILAAVVATEAAAQMATNTSAPARRAGRSATSPRQQATSPRTPAKEQPMTPPFGENEPAAAKQDRINVRAQARINSEVITQLKKGDNVIVLKEVIISRPRVDEPSRWAQIGLPAGTHVWTSTLFLEPDGKVKPRRLNIRSGPGENYSVIGVMQQGETVKVLGTKGDWTEIEAPTNAFGFVASHLLEHREIITTPVVEPVIPITSITTSNETVIASTNEPIVAVAVPTPTPVTPVIPVVSIPVVEEPKPDEPPPRRVVQREGIVGDTVSIQAPTYYHLESLETGKLINYLHTSTTNLSLKMYKGRTVLVSGEESLDERWANTPVLTIEKIQVVK